MQLRYYQQDAIDYCGQTIQDGIKSFIVALPTGSGKTPIFSSMAKMASGNGYTVLILTDSKKLLSQTKKYFTNPVVIEAKSNKNLIIKGGSIIVSMAQTLTRRSKLIAQLNALDNLIVIVDECHIKTSCNPLYKLTNDCIKIGFTATPVGNHLVEIFTRIHEVVTVRELVAQGFLTRCQSWIRKVVDTSGLHKNAGEYSEEEQTEAFKVGYGGLFDDLNKKDYRKAMVYTSCIEQCEQTAEYLNNRGIKCAVVHSLNDNLEDFYNDVDVCISVGMLTKGFDFPEIDLIILFRKTASLPLYLQMCGRGGRKLDGKEFFRVIDYGGNIHMHELWEQDRTWSLEVEKKVKKDSDEDIVNGVKICECEACGFVSIDKFDICPECGEEVKVEIKEDKETELIRWDDTNPFDLSAPDLFKYASEMKSRRWAIGIARRKGAEYLREYAKAAGYNEYWVHRVENNYYL